jgi:nucleoid-associated protein YgaU
MGIVDGDPHQNGETPMSPRPQLVCLRLVPPLRLRLAPLAVMVVFLAAGCEEERNVGGKSQSQGQTQTQAKAKPPAPRKAEFIVGKRTQEIKNAAPELEKGGAKVATTKITAKDYITLQGNAYVTSVGKLSILSIEQAMNLYHAANDRYPKDYDEFMSEIIKANNIALPKLPYYQQYGYNEKEHKLLILEYQELKNEPPPQ